MISNPPIYGSAPITLAPPILTLITVAQIILLTLIPSGSSLFASTAVSLSENERHMADKLAQSRTWQQSRIGLKSGLKTSSHPLGIQTLSVELDERKKGSHLRRARVYQFNYHSQLSRLVLVDLEQHSVVSQQIIDSVHLPLNDEEISTARALIEQNEGIMRKLNLGRQSRGLFTLKDLSTLDVKASIFEPDNHSHDCANQRCALISLFDRTRTVLTIEPLVNLQHSTVTTLQLSLKH